MAERSLCNAAGRSKIETDKQETLVFHKAAFSINNLFIPENNGVNG
jgi:hypothetical protein